MSIIESNKQQTNNSQRNAYQLTINNPLEYGFVPSHHQKDISRELHDSPLFLYGRRDRKRGNTTYTFICIF